MTTEVRAAGGVVRRRGRHGPEFALVHRPRYDDWTFPKGKALEDELEHETAEREVLEETGFRCERGPELAKIRYLDHLGRSKSVRYWLMHPAGGAFTPNAEVDELRWVGATTAGALLSYEHDRGVLASALAFDRPVYLVRHAKARDRATWIDDDVLRPLSGKGSAQAEGLIALFQGFEVDRVVSSPAARCVETVRPLALARSMPVDERDELAEGPSIERALSFVLSTGDAVVMCSHGDVIPAVVERLAEMGAEMPEHPSWKKASTWILERDGGTCTSMRYLAPPG